jgi:predicted CXXCH cytochrome family protein
MAYGPHDNNCVSCHSIHKGQADPIWSLAPYKGKNPATGKPVTGIAALCFSCHAEGLVKPVKLLHSHPVEVVPKKAKVPANLLVNGKISCTGCHDPHPSNPNYRYLVKPTKNGAELGKFCAVCHGDKVGATPLKSGRPPAKAPAKSTATAMVGTKKEAPTSEVKGDTIAFKDTKSFASVSFGHQSHKLKGTCTDCHPKLFTMKKGATSKVDLTMGAMRKGKTCGACHNGKKAFSVSGSCAKCHAN